MTIHLGDLVTVTTTFDGGTPSTIVARVKAPDGTVTTRPTTELSPGVVEFTFQADRPGRWDWRIAGTAGVIGADEGTVRVPHSPIGMETT